MSELLPPCKVCQDSSSGIHYGVPSCDACKGFFGRQMKSKGRKRVCSRLGKCNTIGQRKTDCLPCRYDMCLRAGMSKDAITTGRYSLLRRHSMLTELRQLVETRSQPPSQAVTPAEDIGFATRRLGPNGETVEEIISTIVDSYASLPSHLRSPQKYLDKQVASYSEERNLKQILFGKMPTVSYEEFTEIFRTTGLDIDDRFQLSHVYLGAVQRWLARLVSFARAIPGFNALPFADRFNLVKHNRFEFWFMGAYRGYDPKLETGVNPNGLILHKEDLKKTYPNNVHEIVFDVAKSLKRLELKPEEHIIAQTMCLLFPDRAPLEDRPAVEALQMMLLSCLEYLVNKRPSRQERVRALGHAIDMQINIRGLCHVDEIPSPKGSLAEHLQILKLDFLTKAMTTISTQRP